MPLLFIDAEFASELDINDVGSEVIVRHPSTRVLLWSMHAADWPRPLVFEQAEFWPLVRELRRLKQLEWPVGEGLTLVHWSDVDRLLIEHEDKPPAGWEVDWIDLQAVSLTYCGPAQLGPATEWWGGAEKKDSGKHLIHRFCRPQKDGRWIRPADDPIRWERFRSYAGQDTAAMLPLYEKFVDLAQPGAGGHRWADHRAAWEVVWRMNRRGMPVDRNAAQAATEACERAESALVEECKATYGIKPTQTEEVRVRLGLENVQADTLEEVRDDLPPDLRRLADIRLETAGAARKKLGPLLRMSNGDADPRVRGIWRYHGAWTRRLSSLGVQGQNFVKEAVDEAFFRQLADPEAPFVGFDAVRKNIRGFVAAEPGSIFVAADLAQIELRVGAWLAGETWLLEALATGQDPYKRTAARFYGCSEHEIEKPSKKRDLGKAIELASQFQLGDGGLQRRLLKEKPEKIVITDEEARRAIYEVYRPEHPAYVAAWKEADKAFRELVPADAGDLRVIFNGKVRLERWSTHIKLVRPSGLGQYFWLPEFQVGYWPDGNMKTDLSYIGVGKGGRMARQSTYGGNIFQNAVQGIAADVINEAMGRAEAAGFPIVMSIHDELVAEIGDDGERYVDELCELVAELPAWAEGLPVEAEGWQGRRFTKG